MTIFGEKNVHSLLHIYGNYPLLSTTEFLPFNWPVTCSSETMRFVASTIEDFNLFDLAMLAPISKATLFWLCFISKYLSPLALKWRLVNFVEKPVWRPSYRSRRKSFKPVIHRFLIWSLQLTIASSEQQFKLSVNYSTFSFITSAPIGKLFFITHTIRKCGISSALIDLSGNEVLEDFEI